MKRSDFLKCLAAVIAAPSVLVSLPETVTPVDVAADAGLYEGSAVTMAANSETPILFNAFWWKVSDEQVMDTAYMKFLLTDPRSDFVQAAAKHGIDLSKPHQIQIGFVNDDFIRTLQTIVIKQPKAAA